MKNILLIALVFLLASCASNGQKRFYGTKLANTGFCQASKIVKDNDEAIPCKIQPPQYPRKAAMTGVQGHVKFSITVTEAGKPENIKIVESVPEGVFDKNGMEAISNWVFKAKNVNGSPVRQEDMIYTMQFKLG
jgi:protein TonB